MTQVTVSVRSVKLGQDFEEGEPSLTPVLGSSSEGQGSPHAVHSLLVDRM